MNASNQPLVLNVTVPGFVPQNVIMQPEVSVPVVKTGPAPKAKIEVTDADLHRVHLQDFLFKQVGRFVGLDFIKVEGQARSLNGRLGVRKHLKGGVSTHASDARPYLVVYDVKTRGYRAVNLATVSAVRAQHTRYSIIG